MNEKIKQLAAKANFGHMEKNEVVYSTGGKFIKEHFGVKE